MENAERLPETEGEDSRDVEALIEIIDRCVRTGDSRIKVDVVESPVQGTERRYHHGRCDVGSPWACGAAFDVLEE